MGRSRAGSADEIVEAAQHHPAPAPVLVLGPHEQEFLAMNGRFGLQSEKVTAA
ncbi:hypothetical protein X727_22160 [Mesorhizobium sp. L103C119B0]|nr:hypothetical protein X753_24520 [Mesorhizobium sp. LNJC399B00]ESZ68431.1 hypothetical protein X727_22160 [Mesorhizobium sp. L103C119B0]